MLRRRLGIAGVCTGMVLLLGAGAVRVAAAPALVRFPLNIDETTHYRGQALTYVDQKTLLPLAQPQRVPLTLDRHVKVVSGDFSRAVIRETVTIKTGATTSIEQYQYVMDRRTMQFVSDPRSFAFGDPKATMHAQGAYRVNFAMGTKANGTYLAYIPEADATTKLVLSEAKHYHADAHASVIDFTSKLSKPVAPYYLEHLKMMGLPMQVSTADLQPQLAAAGIDVTRALADVGSRLSPTEQALVTSTLSKPVPLRYYFIADGLISVEPKTGALIDVHSTEEGVAVKPDLSGAAALGEVLQKYSAIPSVKAAADGLARIVAAPPQRAQMLVYTQTVPSSLHMASTARTQAAQMNLIEWRVPTTLVLLGLGLLAFGLFLWLGARPRTGKVHRPENPDASLPPRPITITPPEPAVEERELEHV